MQVRSKFFRSSFTRWQELFAEAASFASQIPPENLITISHSDAGGDGVVTVWYWATEENQPKQAPRST